MRLDDRLILEQHITREQLDEAVRLQIRDGSRVGSALVQLGHMDIDVLAECLGRHYGMPAILSSHFAKAPPELQRRISSEQALCWGAIPIGRLTGDSAEESPIVVAVMEPLPPEAIAELGSALGGPVVLAVTSEIQIQTHLLQVYGVPTNKRVVRVPRAVTASPVAHEAEAEFLLDLDGAEDGPKEPSQNLSASVERSDARPSQHARAGRRPVEVSAESESFTVDLDDLSGLDMTVEDAVVLPKVARDLAMRFGASEPDSRTREKPESSVVASGEISVDIRSSEPERPEPERPEPSRPEPSPTQVPDPGDAVPAPIVDAGSALGRIAIRRGSKVQPASGAIEIIAPNTLEDAFRFLRSAMDRDRIADTVVDVIRDFLAHSLDLGAILVVRGDAAIGWKGFRRSGESDWIGKLSIPLQVPSCIHHTYVSDAVYVGAPPADSRDLDSRMWAKIGCPPPALVATAAIPIDAQNRCFLYAHSQSACTDEVATQLSQQFGRLAKATSKSFKRVIRASQR